MTAMISRNPALSIRIDSVQSGAASSYELENEGTETLEGRKSSFSPINQNVPTNLSMKYGPRNCDLCGQHFQSYYDYKCHVKEHRQENGNYRCPYCKYDSKLKANVATHVRIHTGEKPYGCYICSYRTSQKSSLQQHIFHHTGERPFGCDYCSYRTTQKISLTRHLSNFHPEVEDKN